MVLNNLRVFLILEWLQLVQNFLRVPVVKPSSSYKTCYYHPSQTNTESAATETIMPKTVKSGVVTKRSTVAVTQDRCLDVKVNVTGEKTVVFALRPGGCGFNASWVILGRGVWISWWCWWPPLPQVMKGQRSRSNFTSFGLWQVLRLQHLVVEN